MTKIYESLSPADTFELGRQMGERAKAGTVIALNADLGCGKTVFTQGFAAGLGITEPVTSPTFTILQIYEEGRLPLFDFDVYRIEDEEEMEETGFDEYLDGDGVCLIEWAERVEDLLPADTVRITIEKDTQQGDEYRKIVISE